MADPALDQDYQQRATSDKRLADASEQNVTALAGPERVLRSIASQATSSERSGSRRTNGGQSAASERREPEWSATLELVKEACESIRISEERVATLESELEDFARQSRDDMRTMSGRLSATQEDLKAANARAKAAEARATEAEDWLAKINSAIRDGFGPFLENSNSRDRTDEDSLIHDENLRP